MTTDSARELLQLMCDDLRTLRRQAGGPSLRTLAERVLIGKSQLGAILNGQVREPPDWRVVRGMVDWMLRHAEEHGRGGRVSLPTGVDEYWRHQYAMVEHAFARAPGRRALPSLAENDPAAAVAGSAQTGTSPPDAEPLLAAPWQLPPATRHFVGRGAELGRLEEVLSAARPTGPATVMVIDGMAGVGKTTLALRWAHEVSGDFPDIQLYANMRGFDPCGQPVAPADTIRSFLESLGVPSTRIPASADARAALYRSLLARKRVLMLLDNVRDAEQARPLLPNAPGALVVVTSRDQLTSLVALDGAHRITLDPMPRNEARQLLAERLGEERLAAEWTAVNRIITGCGGLPLALAVAAARAQLPAFGLARLADQLGSARDRLDVLDAGDAASQLRSVFSWSYAALTPAAARLFRLLGLPAADEISMGAVDSLAGERRSETRRALAELVRANLLVEHAPDRYGCHDLLRAYAAELAWRHDPQSQREAATARVLDYYLRSAVAADRLLTNGRPAKSYVNPRQTAESPPCRAAERQTATAERRIRGTPVELKTTWR